jgi:hypothetical protein
MVIMAKHPGSRSRSSGHLAYRPAPDEGPVPKTLEFVRTQLPAWRDDPKRPADSSEKLLNSSLCDFLDSRARSGFPMIRFKHEAPQTTASTVDMGVHGTEEITFVGNYDYTINQPFMVIECKRLPAPSKNREREYVTGTNRTSGGATGGIQRFKLGLHGAKVETATIVGYVEEQTTRQWHVTINGWITDLAAGPSADGCVWSHVDRLQQLVCDDEHGASTAISTHERAEACLTQFIQIHHMWIVMRSGGK